EAGVKVSFEASVIAVPGAKVQFIEDGKPLESAPPSTVTSPASQTFRASWTSDGHRHWFLAQATGPDGKLWLLGNPIYVNWR
ncbi:MAG: PHP domain-containing protein, partial [Terriglobia bacterium]